MTVSQDRPSLSDRLRAWSLYPLPHHALSRIVLAATRCETPWWKRMLISAFLRRFDVTLAEAAQPDAPTQPDAPARPAAAGGNAAPGGDEPRGDGAGPR